MNKKSSDFFLNEIKIEVTHRCNLACIHCSSDAGPNCNREMNTGICLETLAAAVSMGVRTVAFSGGDPLIWDGICEAVKYSSTNNLQVTIYTSGYVQEAEKKLDLLRNNGLSKAVFSIFGPDSESHEHVTRVKGSFDATTSVISYLSKTNIETELHFVPLTHNYRSLRTIAELSRKLGASKVSILRFVPQGRGQLLTGGSLSKLQNMELKKTIETLRSEGHNIRTGSPYNFLMVNENPTCKSGIDRLIIAPDLRIYPCDAFKQIKAEEIVGTSELSRLDRATLEMCWQQSPYLHAVRKQALGELGKPCITCGNATSCASGCMAQKFLSYGTISGRPDPMCLASRMEIAE